MGEWYHIREIREIRGVPFPFTPRGPSGLGTAGAVPSPLGTTYSLQRSFKRYF